MRILLIRPPYSRLRGTGHPAYFPLGLGYLAAVLEQAKFEVFIYNMELGVGECRSEIISDAEATFYQRSQEQTRYYQAVAQDDHPVWQELRQTLNQYKPDLVGVTLLSPEVATARKVSQVVKAWQPACWIVWGGNHPTFLPGESLSYPEVDIVVRGEGEYTLREVCQNLAKGQTDLEPIQGISFKDQGGIRHNPDRPLIENLDEIPFPARHRLLFYDRFDHKNLGCMIITRGCPWRCAFCSSRNFWEKRVRFRSPENIVAELRQLQDSLGMRYVMLWDDSFSINRDIVLRYCQAVIASGIEIMWRTATRADLVTEELLSWMKKAGCTKLEIGVETGSPRMQRLIHKDIDNADVVRAFTLLQKEHIPAGAFFMAGFPEETLDDLQQTFDLMKSIPALEIAFNIFDPMPGSELLDTCKKLGLVPPDPDWSTFLFWPDQHFMKYITPAEFNQQAYVMAKWIYAHNNRLLNLWRKQGYLAWFLLRHDPKFVVKKVLQRLKKRLQVHLLKRHTGALPPATPCPSHQKEGVFSEDNPH
jgi:anaerobic magnesium-protoporphyrin IX monomethyl ester cyclase